MFEFDIYINEYCWQPCLMVFILSLKSVKWLTVNKHFTWYCNICQNLNQDGGFISSLDLVELYYIKAFAKINMAVCIIFKPGRTNYIMLNPLNLLEKFLDMLRFHFLHF